MKLRDSWRKTSSPSVHCHRPATEQCIRTQRLYNTSGIRLPARRSSPTIGGSTASPFLRRKRALNAGELNQMSCVNEGKRLVAYFSMEIALESSMPGYSGGLGVLAGDTIRSAADLRLPMVAVSLLYRKGYFSQRLAEDGTQTEESVEWRVEDFLHEEAPRVTIPLEDRRVELRCWRYSAIGVRGYEVPIYFLDADLPSNAPAD